VTHRTAPLSICDQVTFMMDGRIERTGTPDEIIPYARDRMAENRRSSARAEAPDDADGARGNPA